MSESLPKWAKSSYHSDMGLSMDDKLFTDEEVKEYLLNTINGNLEEIDREVSDYFQGTIDFTVTIKNEDYDENDLTKEEIDGFVFESKDEITISETTTGSYRDSDLGSLDGIFIMFKRY